ncbi:MAG: T9SS type A sorting domain-containing protein, partial [Bacteroidales bacterium]
YIEYMVNGTPQEPSTLAYEVADIFSGDMVFQEGSLQHGDSIQYRIVAVDSSQSGNIAYHPDSAYHVFYASAIPEAVDTYSNDFNLISNDFLGNGFALATPAGFNDQALHTNHPYESPDMENQFINYIAQLRYPIRVNDTSAYMKYDEIVLVEPGEIGVPFGEEGFWDYVIVEVSKDLGVSWIPVIDGYDCRFESVWYGTYNSSIDANGNSLAVASPNLFRTHEINLLKHDSIQSGDEIIIRFRLFSDPFLHGWGWVIDNLQIQGYISSVQNNLFHPGEILIYPNPSSSYFNIKGTFRSQIDELDIMVTDLLGREILRRTVQPAGIQLFETINLTGFEEGVYFIRLKAGNRQSVYKIFKSS